MKITTSTIGKIAQELKTGKTPPTNKFEYFNGATNWYTPTDLDQETYLSSSQRTITELAIQDKKAFLFKPQTVLIGCIGNIGKIGMIREAGASNQQVTGVLTDAQKVLPEYFFYWCKRNKHLLEKNAKKAIVPILNNKQLGAIPISFPTNLDDQRRIALVLQKTELLIKQREESISLLSEFLKNSFLEMFGDPGINEKSFRKVKLHKLFQTKPQNGLYKHASQYGSGNRILRIDSFYDGEVTNINDLRRVLVTPEEAEKYALNENDIVINRVNSRSHLGKCGLIPSLNEVTVYESNMMRFSVKEDQLNPKYFIRTLSSKHLKSQILRAAKDAVNQSSINQKDVCNFDVLVPPLELQNQFAAIVDQTEKLKNEYLQSLSELKELYKILSYNAFNGGLTIIEKFEIEGNIQVQPKISATIELIDQKQPDATIQEPTKEKEEVTATIRHISFLKTEEDLLSHISKKCSGSHFTFEEIKVAIKESDWQYDFEELKNLVFKLVRKKQLKQVFADASYKSGFNNADADFEKITNLSEQIYFKRIL